MKKIFVSIIILIFPLISICQSLNGTAWNDFGKLDGLSAKFTKLMVISAMIDGAIYSNLDDEIPPIALKISNETIVNELDMFYKELANNNIPIYHAIELFGLKLKGATKSTYENKLIQHRKKFY